MPPKLSVITITYQDPVGLRATARSLQFLTNERVSWEHIIVDSSSEQNKSVLNELGANWPLVHLKTPAQGIYRAFNDGIAAASGDYIWFLNSGDRAKGAKQLLAALERFNLKPFPDVVCGQAERWFESHYLYTWKPAKTWIGNLIGSNRLCHQALLYKKSALQKVGTYSERFKLAGDYEHHFRSYAAKLSLACIDEVLIEYDNSGSSSNHILAFHEFKQVQRNLSSGLPLWMNLGNELRRAVEWSRISALKSFSKSKISSVLRSVWLAWNRRKDSSN